MNLSVSMRALVPAAALVLPLVFAGPASATSWSKVLRVGSAKSQACKTPINRGRAWQVKVRLVNGEDAQYRSTYTVTGAGGRVVDRVKLVARPGTTTAVKTLVIRRVGSQRLGASLATAEGALGDSSVLHVVGRC